MTEKRILATSVSLLAAMLLVIVVAQIRIAVMRAELRGFENGQAVAQAQCRTQEMEFG